MYIPELAAPVRRSGQENIAPERVASHSVNSPGMSVIRVQISLRVTLAASIHSSFFSRSQIDIGFALNEFKGKTSSLSEVNPFILPFFLSRVILSLQVHKILILQSFFHAPFDHSAIRGDRNQTFASFGTFADPLDLPDTVGMFAL